MNKKCCALETFHRYSRYVYQPNKKFKVERIQGNKFEKTSYVLIIDILYSVLRKHAYVVYIDRSKQLHYWNELNYLRSINYLRGSIMSRI